MWDFFLLVWAAHSIVVREISSRKVFVYILVRNFTSASDCIRRNKQDVFDKSFVKIVSVLRANNND